MSGVQAVYTAEGTRVEITGLDQRWEIRCDGCGQLITDERERISIEQGTVHVPGARRQFRPDLHRRCIGMLPGIILALLPAEPAQLPAATDDEEPF